VLVNSSMLFSGPPDVFDALNGSATPLIVLAISLSHETFRCLFNGRLGELRQPAFEEPSGGAAALWGILPPWGLRLCPQSYPVG